MDEWTEGVRSEGDGRGWMPPVGLLLREHTELAAAADLIPNFQATRYRITPFESALLSRLSGWLTRHRNRRLRIRAARVRG